MWLHQLTVCDLLEIGRDQVTGSCANCLAQGCICDQLVITRNSMEPDRIHVILVDEVLGY